jgi:hypothetical protein
MTIVEFIQKHENLFKIDENSNTYFKDLPPEILLELQNEVDLFKEAKLSVMHSPTEDGKLALSCLLHDESLFVGECKLYSMVFTPEIYKKEDFFTKFPIITPVIYDTNDFIPIQYMVLPIYPETVQDMSATGGLSKFKKFFHSIIDDFFEEPDQFKKVSGYRGIMLRGILTLKQTDNQNSKPIQIKTK